MRKTCMHLRQLLRPRDDEYYSRCMDLAVQRRTGYLDLSPYYKLLGVQDRPAASDKKLVVYLDARGRVHRPDGPALALRMRCKNIYHQRGFDRSFCACCSVNEAGQEWDFVFLVWCWRGRIYRADGPAFVKLARACNNNSAARHTPLGEKWYQIPDVLHRTHGPAVIAYSCGDGTRRRQQQLFETRWYCKGRLHRDGDRPACIVYNTLGTVNYSQCFVHGVKSGYLRFYYPSGELEGIELIGRKGVTWGMQWHRDGRLRSVDFKQAHEHALANKELEHLMCTDRAAHERGE